MIQINQITLPLKLQLQQKTNQKYNKNQQQLNLYNEPQFWHILINNRSWSMIRTLDLIANQINDKSLQHLFVRNQWQCLQTLLMSKNRISGNGVKLIVFKKWDTLVNVDLQGNMVDEDGCALFMFYGPKLNQLNLSMNVINMQNMKINNILNGNSMDKFQNMMYLNLDMVNIGTNGVKLLSKLNMIHLQIVRMKHSQLTTQSLKHLSKNHWLCLRKLYINENKLSLDSMSVLTANKWPKLVYIHSVINSNIMISVFYMMMGWNRKLAQIENNLGYNNNQMKEFIVQIIKRM